MKTMWAKSAACAALLAAAMFAASTPASAQAGIAFGPGGPDYLLGDPCDYYEYYDEAPPWGLPPDYCDYPVYYEPVFYGGYWYRGPIYYRWYRGRRLFWLHGKWRGDEWRGPRPAHIQWQHRGGSNNGLRPGVRLRGDFRGGVSRPRELNGTIHFGNGGRPGSFAPRSWPGNSGGFGPGRGGFGAGGRGSPHGASHGGFGGRGPH
jgi:hypothetical protein